MLVLIIVLILLYIADHIATLVYCKHQERKTARPHDRNTEDQENNSEKVLLYHFPKKQIKAILHLYQGWLRYKLILLGKIPCHAYRNWILRHIYRMKIGKHAVIYGGFEIRAPWNIEIGDGTIIGDESKLDGRNGIIIGRNVNFSTGVWIWTNQHDLNDPGFATNSKGGSVIIRDRAWISSRASILPGIQVEEGCVLAAGAVAVKNLEPAFTVWGGVPAKKISNRNSQLSYEFDGTHGAFW